MRICIFGAGSLGSALGGILSRNHEVALIARRENVLAVRRSGLRLSGDIVRTARVEAYEDPEGIEPPELLVMATKAYDTTSAIRQCRSWVTKETRVLTLQNGLGNLEVLRKWLGQRAFGGTTSMGATMLRPGVVKVSGLGKTVVGADMDPEGAKMIVRALLSCELPARTERNILGEIWSKAIVNACINPTTAILDVPNGRLLDSRVIVRLMAAVCDECELIAMSSGVELPRGSLKSRVRAVARDTSENTSSMLQDVRREKRTEIAQMNGAFCDQGRLKGISTPMNSTLAAMVEALGTGKVVGKG